MANTYHDQLTGADLHDNKVYPATGSELSTWGPTDGRYPQKTLSINTTAPLLGGGSLAAARTLSLPAATASVDGYLPASDWAKFNAKQTKAFITVGLSSSGADFVCDGIADQAEHKAAIDAADAVGGGVVRLLPGTYNLSSSISCTLLNHYNNISVIGSGRGATILKAVANNVSILAFGSGDANAGIVPMNLHFAHFTLDMNNTTGAAYGMAIACCQDVTLDNLHFKNQKNGAKSMLFFGVSSNASSVFDPRHLLASNCIFRDKTAIYSFLNYGSYDVACVACEFANCSTGVNGHGDTIFSGCNFFGSSVTVQADNTIFIGCGFRNILNAYAGGIKFLGYETTSNEQGWDETGSNVPVILKGNKVIGCNFDHCNTVAIQAYYYSCN